MSVKTLKIIVADSSFVMRKGLEALLKRMTGYRVQITEIESFPLLYDTLKKKNPDWLIINPTLLSHSALINIKEEVGGNFKIIALPLSIGDLSIHAGYDEVINIYEQEGNILNRLHQLIEKEEEDTPEEDTQQVLSAREKEIVVYVVKGMTNREIADKLYLSTHTVITHRRNITRKLKIRSASGLTIYAIVNKLVQLDEVEHLYDIEH